MSEKKATIAQAFKMLGEALGLTSASAEQNEVVSLELSTATGDTINVEREEGEVQVGDKTDAAEGEVTLADGRVLVIDADGIITEIKPAEEDTSEEETELEALKAQVAQLTEQLNTANAQVAQLQKLTSKATIPASPQARGKQKPEIKVEKQSQVSARLQALRNKK